MFTPTLKVSCKSGTEKSVFVCLVLAVTFLETHCAKLSADLLKWSHSRIDCALPYILRADNRISERMLLKHPRHVSGAGNRYELIIRLAWNEM